MATSLFPTLRDVVRNYSRFSLELLAGPLGVEPLAGVVGVFLPDSVLSLSRGVLAVDVRQGRDRLPDYVVESTIREAAARGVAGIVLRTSEELSLPVVRVAERSRVALLAPRNASRPLDLLVELDRYVRGGAADALTRADRAMDAARAFEDRLSDGFSASDVVRAVESQLGVRVSVSLASEGASPAHASPTEELFPLLWQGQWLGEIVVREPDEASRVVLPYVALLVTRAIQLEVESRFAPSWTRAELIAQIALSDAAELPSLSERARRLGFPIHQGHAVAWISVRSRGDAEGLDFRHRALLRLIEVRATQFLDGVPGTWHVARIGDDVIVTCSVGVASAAFVDRLRSEIGTLISRIESENQVATFSGLSSVQFGPDGLRSSLAEARAAAQSASGRDVSGVLVEADAAGLRRVVTDLYALPLSRDGLRAMLGPLLELPERKSLEAVHTLQVFLDHGLSFKRAGETLHLHPNAVKYRVAAIRRLLRVDMDDAEVRIALQLACRMFGPADSASA